MNEIITTVPSYDAGTYDIVLSPAKYKAYNIMRKIRRLV